MDQLISKLRVDYPNISFLVGATTKWCPSDNTITYRDLSELKDAYGVLHELGHALLGHESFDTDVDLLNKEVAAWDEANKLAKKYDVAIDDDHQQDCLDTYRDWVHKRSSCPTCGIQGVQSRSTTYSCLNCSCTWDVTDARLHRPYRRVCIG